MKRILSLLLSASVLIQSSSLAVSADDARYIYRYKDHMASAEIPTTEDKDVSAYFVGGVGYPFNEILPLKPEWQDDDWEITSGSMPDGITFDAVNRTFQGTPTSAGADNVLYLHGTDSNGNRVAEAKVSFDIRTIRGVPVKLDIYAHTGKYKVAEATIPSNITVDRWERVNVGPLPPGISANGPFLEGTPTQAGQWQYMVEGLDYMGEAVVTVFGNYLVEDRPTFPNINDMVYKLPQMEYGLPLQFAFGAPSNAKVNHVIDPKKAVRYYVERDPTTPSYPGNVNNTGVAPSVRLEGDVWEPYDTALIRYKAVDSDGVEGWSNWFRFGSSDPQPSCNPWVSQPLTFKTGRINNVTIPRPLGDQGVTTYSLSSGSLPDGLSLVAATGVITGTPTKSGQKTDIVVQIDVTGSGGTTSKSCPYSTEVIAAGTSIKDVTVAQARHVRLNDIYTGSAQITGGIQNYTVGFSDPSNTPQMTFTTATTNTDLVTVSGPVTTAGRQDIGLKLENGDGSKRTGSLTLTGYDEVSVGDMQTVTVKRLAAAQTWGTVPYDKSTVIPDVTTGDIFPKFTLDVPGQLPSDIDLTTAGEFVGGTTSPVGQYGPFVATMRDYSGDQDSTKPFMLVVQDRDRIVVKPPENKTFTVETADKQTLPAPKVEQPELAKGFKVTYILTGDLPTWLKFNTDTGKFTADANLDYGLIGKYGPFTITATDSEGSTDDTDPFELEVKDWPFPDTASKGLVKGTVTGNTTVGEAATWVNITGLRSLIKEETVIGGKANVTFLSAEPSSPAGLVWNAQDGSFSGPPSEEFNGPVTVTFEDAKKRHGSITFPLEVRPYPTVKTAQQSFEIARLSQAAQAEPAAQGLQVSGFWNQPAWSLDTAKGSKLPAGLTVEQSTGKIIGKPTDEIDTVVQNLVLKATSVGGNSETLESWTAPFSIKITKQAKLSLSYNPITTTYYLNEIDKASGTYTLNHKDGTTPKVGGSYVDPLTYTIDLSQASGMTGTIGINPKTGVITGNPDTLGNWPVQINLHDAEGQSMDAPVDLTIKSTLAGDIKHTDQNASFTLRIAEPFKTPSLLPEINSYVGSVLFSAYPAAMPSTALSNFDPATGEFTDASSIDTPTTSYAITVDAKDSDGRTFGSSLVKYGFKVIDKLAIATAPVSAPAKQYEVSKPVDLAFNPTVSNVMKAITYGIDSPVPGTLVSRYYDPESGSITEYAWSDETSYHSVKLDQTTGSVREYLVDGVPGQLKTVTNPDGSTVPSPAETYFPIDALVFDTMDATLKGTPSKSGTFPLTITAYDSHANDYIRNVSTKESYNRARSSTFDLTVEAAEPLIVTSSAKTETLGQYSDTPSITHMVTGAAYGLPVKWTQTGGTLPEGIAGNKAAAQVSYTGYPETQGTFPDIAWQAKDEAGRTAVSDPTVTLVVGPPKPLAVTSTGTSETIPQYTGQPTTTHTATGGVYGGKVTWTMLSGTLPSNVTASKGATQLSYSGYPDVQGTSANIVWRATDARGRYVDTSALTMTVGPRLPLELEATFTPPIYVIGSEIAPNTVTARNIADGKVIPAADWKFTAVNGLPPGLSSEILDGKVVFSGTPTETGEWASKVSAVDSRGGQANLSMPFKVIPTDDEISLTVTDIRTKVGYPYSMQSSASNTYGKIRFYSHDISGELASQLDLNGTSGLVTGTFNSIGDRDFDVYVTDETNRVTSKPVIVNVIPDLKLTVPQIVAATQGTPVTRTIATDYVLGGVTYAKGSGDWPEGFVVDPDTGTISSQYTNPTSGVTTTEVVAAPGEYKGLTIIGTDTFTNVSGTFTDVQPSNGFTVVVEPTTAIPDISNQPKTILGTEGQALAWTIQKQATTWAAGVVEKGKLNRAWTAQGTVFEANYDLKEYGLDFNKANGEITGTPTKPFIIRDFVITVTSARGDTDSTTPFWLGVAPKDDMVLNAGIKTSVNTRIAAPFDGAPELVWDNAIGNLTHVKLNGNTAFIVTAANGKLTKSSSTNTANWVVGTYPVGIQVTDEFNRTATTSISVVVQPKLEVVPSPATVIIAQDADYTPTASIVSVAAKGLIGSPTWTVTGLPDGLWFDQTNLVIVGKVAAGRYPIGTEFTVNYSLTDSEDGAVGTATSTMSIREAHTYWRIWDNSTTGNWWWNTSGGNLGTGYSGQDTTARFQGWGAIYSTFYEGSVDVSSLKVQNTALPDKGRNYQDTLWDLSGYADPWQIKRDATGAWWKVWKFNRPVSVTKVTWRWGDASNAQYSAILRPNIQYSDDGVTWTTLWSQNLSRSSAQPQGTTCPTTICAP